MRRVAGHGGRVAEIPLGGCTIAGAGRHRGGSAEARGGRRRVWRTAEGAADRRAATAAAFGASVSSRS